MCTVASVKRVLLAAPGVVSLCAVGVSSVSAIVVLSSPLSSSSLLLLSAPAGPLFEYFCVVGSCVAAFTPFFPCRLFVISLLLRITRLSSLFLLLLCRCVSLLVVVSVCRFRGSRLLLRVPVFVGVVLLRCLALWASRV